MLEPELQHTGSFTVDYPQFSTAIFGKKVTKGAFE
jgi:hypothetical protein